jgi:hypothetical protein
VLVQNTVHDGGGCVAASYRLIFDVADASMSPCVLVPDIVIAFYHFTPHTNDRHIACHLPLIDILRL